LVCAGACPRAAAHARGWTAVATADDHVPMGMLPEQSRARVRAYALWLIAAVLLVGVSAGVYAAFF